LNKSQCGINLFPHRVPRGSAQPGRNERAGDASQAQAGLRQRFTVVQPRASAAAGRAAWLLTMAALRAYALGSLKVCRKRAGARRPVKQLGQFQVVSPDAVESGSSAGST
jgi:hypothetical protein